MLTTTGIVRLAIAAKEGGRFSNAPRLAPITALSEPIGGNNARLAPSTGTNKPRNENLLLDIPIGLPPADADST